MKTPLKMLKLVVLVVHHLLDTDSLTLFACALLILPLLLGQGLAVWVQHPTALGWAWGKRSNAQLGECCEGCVTG